jgi:SAM-dependent methyltransferase
MHGISGATNNEKRITTQLSGAHRYDMPCRVCDSNDLELVVDLGMQPWGNHFLKETEIGVEPKYPLRVVYCEKCTTAQLDVTVKKEIMFGDHTYLSGVTKSTSDYFRGVAREVDQRFFSGSSDKSAFDIGSNDGTQLKHFKALDYDVLGVDSSKGTAEIANNAGIPTVNDFFNLNVARSLNRKFHVINAAGVFYHLEELHSVTDGVRELLRDDGVFVVQFVYMKRMMENLSFDQIYHEHLLYYNLANIEYLLNRHGLELFDAHMSPIHGGSVIGFAGHTGRRSVSERLHELRRHEIEEGSNNIENYRSFAKCIAEMKVKNLNYLSRAKEEAKAVFGMGAPVKGNTLLNFFGVGTQYLDCLVEKNELRRGLYSPGMHIPIVLEREVLQQPDVYYVLAWNFRDEILDNNRELVANGVEFYFPVIPRNDL